jgi:hypothetical protein
VPHSCPSYSRCAIAHRAARMTREPNRYLRRGRRHLTNRWAWWVAVVGAGLILSCLVLPNAGSEAGLPGQIKKAILANATLPASSVRLWVARYSSPGRRADDAFAVAMSPDGRAVFVTGLSPVLAGPDYETIAYDAGSGGMLWEATYNGPGNASDAPSAIGVSPDGSKVFVTGQSVGAPAAKDYAPVGYDASSGTQLWVSRYDRVRRIEWHSAVGQPRSAATMLGPWTPPRG